MAYRVLDPKGRATNSASAAKVCTDEIIKMYEAMVYTSIMDRIMFDAQRQGKISFYLMSTGEEAIAAGSASALSPQDVVFAQYRETAMFRYRGFSAKDFMSQLFATVDDPGKGRNMPVQYGSKRLNCHTISAPLATQIPQAAGAAYALKMKAGLSPESERAVVACYFGDGAASEGDFHAGLNIAATRNCPVIYICRNNGYAISTSSQDQYRGDGIASRGPGYGIATIRVDGNDTLAVREAVGAAREHALCSSDSDSHNARPVLVEAMSYRMAHHSTSDDSSSYRTREEMQAHESDSPIVRLRLFMEHNEIWTAEDDERLRHRCRQEILRAYREAEKARHPALRNMIEDVYKETTEEQEAQWRTLCDVIARYPEEYDTSAFESEKTPPSLSVPSPDRKASDSSRSV